MTAPSIDWDSPWKDILEAYFPDFSPTRASIAPRRNSYLTSLTTMISASAEFFAQFLGTCPLREQVPKSWVSNGFCMGT